MKRIILLFFVIAFITGLTYSQNVSTTSIKKPFFTIETSGAIDLPIMDLKENSGIGGFYKFTDYGAKTGFGTALNLKFAVYNAKTTQLRTYLTIGYSQFTNEDTKATVLPNGGWLHVGYPRDSSYKTPRDTSGVSNMRINMPSIAVGCEFGIYTDRKYRSSINFGIDYVFNVIFGKYYQTVKGQTETFTTLSSNFRMGLGINATYSYQFSPIVGFHVGTRFVASNLFGKDAKISDEDAGVYLLDKGDGSINKDLKSNRAIGYLRFFGGLSVFIGKM